MKLLQEFDNTFFERGCTLLTYKLDELTINSRVINVWLSDCAVLPKLVTRR